VLFTIAACCAGVRWRSIRRQLAGPALLRAQ
jgi:hypothetical protein